MRDAFGGIVNLAIIVVFLVLVSGYLAFNVNYTKAFRAKNYIISKFEQYEGDCTDTTDRCYKDIEEYARSLGYDTGENFNPVDSTNDGGCTKLFCYIKVDVNPAGDNEKNKNNEYENEGYKKVYYKIVTQINIDIPIINRILPNLRLFQVTGSTKQIVERN